MASMRRFLLLSLATLWAFAALGQQRTVTGVVTSAEDGNPLPQLSVMLKGSTPTGVVTDPDGRYRIQVPGPEAVLQFVYMGMATQEITVGDRSEINVVMQPVDVAIEQAVITGYGKTARAAFTGSASTLSDKQFKDRVATNPIKALEGTVPGLQMTTGTGQPGAPATIFIRGRNSLNSGTQPLYVIDGVPYQSGTVGIRSNEGVQVSPLATLNPDDIESYTVLKDATATSIYGARAANGVIVITTKQGKQGSFNVNLTARVGAEMMPAYAEGYHLVNTTQFKEMVDEAIANSQADPRSWLNRQTSGGFTTLEDAKDWVYSKVLGRPNPKEWANTDWMKEVTRVGLVQDYSLNISAGGAGEHSLRHFLSLGYTNNQAVVRGKDLERFSFRYNMNQKPTRYFRYGINLSASQSNVNAGARGGYFSDPITQALFLAPIAPVRTATGEWNFRTSTRENPVAMRSKYGDKNQLAIRKFLFVPFIDIIILPELVFTSRLGGDVSLVDEFGYWSMLYSQGRAMNGMGENTSNIDQLYTWTNMLNYNATLAELHHLNAMVGWEAQYNHSKYAYLAAKGYPVKDLTDVSLAATPSSASTGREELRLQSIIGNVQYDFSDRYFISGSLRFDGSSRFHPSHYWAPFWSLGVKYNITKESYMEPVAGWMNLMLRASYGTSGNQVVGSGWYAWRDLYAFGHSYNNRPGSYHYQFGNKELTWERTQKFNVGLDLGLFQRINLTVDYYYHLTDDMVFEVPISYTTGHKTTDKNMGQLSNTGVEFSIRGEVIRTEDWNWTLTLVGSHNRNRLEKLSTDKPIEDGFRYYQKGYDIYTFKLKEWAGVDPQTGHGTWIDSAGRPTDKYNKAPESIAGSASPKFQGSITSELSWKGIDLSVQFTTSLGGKIYLNSARYTEQSGARIGSNYTKWVYDHRWKKPGDNALVPKLTVRDAGADDSHSTRYLVNGNYFKLKTITLGYTLPKAWAQRIFTKGIRIYVTGENLYTWHSRKFRGFDPAGIAADGIMFFNYPIPTTVVGGINVNF